MKFGALLIVLAAIGISLMFISPIACFVFAALGVAILSMQAMSIQLEKSGVKALFLPTKSLIVALNQEELRPIVIGLVICLSSLLSLLLKIGYQAYAL
jgi:hypothetical protein